MDGLAYMLLLQRYRWDKPLSLSFSSNPVVSECTQKELNEIKEEPNPAYGIHSSQSLNMQLNPSYEEHRTTDTVPTCPLYETVRQ